MRCAHSGNVGSVIRRSRDAGPVSSKRRWKPRDTVLRGVRVEKKQVNSVSLTLGASRFVIFYLFSHINSGFGNYIGP